MFFSILIPYATLLWSSLLLLLGTEYSATAMVGLLTFPQFEFIIDCLNDELRLIRGAFPNFFFGSSNFTFLTYENKWTWFPYVYSYTLSVSIFHPKNGVTNGSIEASYILEQ